ncbi:hypothetical protein ACOJBM_01975 [Rhizobium beringeri]
METLTSANEALVHGSFVNGLAMSQAGIEISLIRVPYRTNTTPIVVITSER